MIEFKSKLGSFNIPTSFADLKMKDLEYLRKNRESSLKVFARLTGLKEEKVMILNLDPILPHLDFLDKDVLDSIDESEEIFIEERRFDIPSDISRLQWGQKLLSSDAVRDGRIIDALSIYLQPIYFDEAFDADKAEKMNDVLENCDVESVYGGAKFIIKQLEELADKEVKALKSEISHEQKLAGIESFNQLGHFNSIDMIAGGDVLKYEDVLALDYNTIFNKLFLMNLTTKFEKRYSEIMKPKPPPKKRR